ncbi:hypothetical protein [Candidatus Parabeggiatoa sp. HSG14]|uniref:hypothetical protein n=1 Tax=Candidatus Parabeggiatoa sp. HSG14 TaxID=3055593 RepID=UPI0025A76128|nr:hypothetical protein [Thiotrichales bacterium HSG14]
MKMCNIIIFSVMCILLCSQPIHAVLDLNDGSGTVFYPIGSTNPLLVSLPNDTVGDCDTSASPDEQGILSVKYTVMATIAQEIDFYIKYILSGTTSFSNDITYTDLVTSTLGNKIVKVEGGSMGDNFVTFLIQPTTNVSEGDEILFCLPGVNVDDVSTPVEITFQATTRFGNLELQPPETKVLLRFDLPLIKPISLELPPIYNPGGKEVLLFGEAEELPLETLSFGNVLLEVWIDNGGTDNDQLGILDEGEIHLSDSKQTDNGMTIGKVIYNKHSKVLKVKFNNAATKASVNDVIGNISYTPDLMPGIRTIKLIMSDGNNEIADIKVKVIVGAMIKLFANENSIVEAGTLAGIFNTADGNINVQAYVYSLVEGEGDTHNGLFTIEGNELKTLQEINFNEEDATQNLHFVRIKTLNKLYPNLYFEKTFGILVMKPNTNSEPSVPNNELSITYKFTAETVYDEIEISNTKLRWKSIPRSEMDQECANSVASYPCWSYDNIVTKEATLTTAEINELNALMERLNIMNLQEEYGEEPHQRSYPHHFSFHFQGKEKSIIYRSSPDVPSMPDALKTIQDTLWRLIKENFSSS